MASLLASVAAWETWWSSQPSNFEFDAMFQRNLQNQPTSDKTHEKQKLFMDFLKLKD